ncbi:MAG: hypothetical protein R3174_13425 [Gammaproteobacteria bacterium]|nr:hypothetical protein [Gammaproteobacteria bacterium]
MTIAEPAVTLTDYGLAIECGVFVFLLCSKRVAERGLRNGFIVFFAALGTAALTGGTVHGFFPDGSSVWHTALWNATLIAIGLVALSAWRIGGELVLSRRIARAVLTAASALFLLYCTIVLFIVNIFAVAILHYLPAVAFLFAAYLIRYLRHREGCFLMGLIGLGLTFIAAGVQQAGIALHPDYFDHNALYHLIQALALLLLYLSARSMVRTEDRPC